MHTMPKKGAKWGDNSLAGSPAMVVAMMYSTSRQHFVLCSALEIVVNNVRFSERGGELEKITWGFRVEVQHALCSSAKLEKR